MTRHPAVRLGILAAIVVGGLVVARVTPVGQLLAAAAREVAGFAAREPWAPLAYIGLYGLALAVALPGTILTIVGGVAFGSSHGFLFAFAVNLAGALLGASLAFFEARFLARDAARMLCGHHLARLRDLASPRRSAWIFLRLRLIAIVPFNGLNFAAGLTETRFLPYLGGTALGILPSTAVYTGFAADLARHGAAEASAVWRVGLFLLGFGLLGVAPTLWQLARRRVKSAHGSREPGRRPVSGASRSDLPRPRSA